MTELKLVETDSDSDSNSDSDDEKPKSKSLTSALPTSALQSKSTSTKPRIGIQTAPPTPERPTMIKDPEEPAMTGKPANIGVSPPGAEPGKEDSGKGQDGEKTWWELLKSKADRLKQELKGWWGNLTSKEKTKDKDKDKDGK
jgi:hypothetical protein